MTWADNETERKQERGSAMRAFVTASAMIALGVGISGCGGSGYSSGTGNSTSPTPPPNGSGVVTINVVGINGGQSFSPNPATPPAGQMGIWDHVHRITHPRVLNDRSVDHRELTPRVSSQSVANGGPGRQVSRS